MFKFVKKKSLPFFTEQYINTNGILNVINDILNKKEQVLLIYIDLIHFELVERSYGEVYVQEFLQYFKKILSEQIQLIRLPDVKYGGTYHLWGDDFVVILSGRKNVKEDIHKLLITIEHNIKQVFASTLPSYFKNYNGMHIGFSNIEPPINQLDKQYYKALKEAYKIAKKAKYYLPQHLLNEFENILKYKQLKSVFQPIISLEGGDVFGWEALIRGPKNSAFHSPSELFNFAEKSGHLFSLEKQARELSIQSVNKIQPNQKLFLNVNPTVINDPSFSQGVTRKILKQYELSPQQIVFEITERTSIQNFDNFRKIIDHYRNQGYLIAVDDAGAGYSSLQAIAEIKPDFIKLDMSIVKGVDNDSVKRALLETFVTFTQKINCQLIAEGIETANELAVLTRLGVHYGQGFYISKPSYPKPEPSNDSIKTINSVFNRNLKTNWYDKNIIAKDLISYVPTVSNDTIIEDIADMFESQNEAQGIVIVDGNRRPLGILLRQNLYKILVARYGVSLYYGKPVEEVMNTRPLTVQLETPIDVVAKLAMKRETQYLYDFIIVVDREQYLGIITVQNLLECLTQMKVEQARYANPLTGLPGNILIEKEIEQRLLTKTKDVVMYIDIDFFKPYNDLYGFEQGDQFILFISKILKHTVKRYKDIFVGHIGGDDFVIICPTGIACNLAEQILNIYQRINKYYYNKEDWEAQALIANDRLGRNCVYPLSTLSIAGIHIDNDYINVIKVAEQAALLKKEVKKIPSNAYIID